MAKETKEIYDIFEKLVMDNEVTDFPLTTLTSAFHKLEKVTSYEMGYYDHRQAYHVIKDISNFLKIHLKESKSSIGQTYKRILLEEINFVNWYKSLPVPYKKYICVFLDFGDSDFLKGFLTEEEISEHFNNISWSRAALISTLYLDGSFSY